MSSSPVGIRNLYRPAHPEPGLSLPASPDRIGFPSHHVQEANDGLTCLYRHFGLPPLFATTRVLGFVLDPAIAPMTAKAKAQMIKTGLECEGTRGT